MGVKARRFSEGLFWLTFNNPEQYAGANWLNLNYDLYMSESIEAKYWFKKNGLWMALIGSSITSSGN